MTTRNQLAIVTGASSGIGRQTAELLAQRGWHVLAGVRKAADGDALAADNIEPVLLDITDQAQVDAIAQRVERDPLGRPLSVLVNNAGIAINAPIETLPLDDWRRHFEVNFFGQVAMTQALLPALLASRGRVVNVSSIGGRVALPTYGSYSASKFALEAFSDVLRRELDPFGITVIIVEPGTVATGLWDKKLAAMREMSAGWNAGEHGRYDSLMATMIKQSEDVVTGSGGVKPADAAQVIVDAITADAPEARYLIGEDAESAAQAAGSLADHDLDQMLAEMLSATTRPATTPGDTETLSLATGR
jgi:NAD(P)-dependent dehydrogenase (short-subunit alcohol dehydrogenase family)